MIGYDASCPWCRKLVRGFGRALGRTGFALRPLVSPAGRPAEMILTRAARAVLWGADALIALGRHVKWLRPLAWLSAGGTGRAWRGRGRGCRGRL